VRKRTSRKGVVGGISWVRQRTELYGLISEDCCKVGAIRTDDTHEESTMMNKKQIVTAKGRRSSALQLVAVTTLMISLGSVLAACATPPQPPTQALQAAELAINNAEQARVADYSSPELVEAREKMTAARLAVEKKDMLAAHRYAEQARVDADLATAKSGVAKAKAVNDEMQKSNSTLKEEMQRNTGAK
jgi:predicted DNA-binding protein (UPF0251 family)